MWHFYWEKQKKEHSGYSYCCNAVSSLLREKRKRTTDKCHIITESYFESLALFLESTSLLSYWTVFIQTFCYRVRPF